MKIVLQIAFLMYANVFATAQIPDILIYNNDTLAMLTNPLDQLFDEHPEMEPQSGAVSTANWRGYTANWVIQDSVLLLNDIFSNKFDIENNSFTKVSVLNSVFKNTDKPVSASWYSGYLLIPKGKMIKYVHIGYSTEYEKYIYIKIDKGRIEELTEKSNTEVVSFRKNQFEKYKVTQDYIKNIERLKKDYDSTGINLDTFMLMYLTDELLKDFK